MKETIYGLVDDKWEIDTLGHLCGPGGIQTGPFGSQLHQRDYLPVGTPIITVEHLGDNRILHQDLPRVSDDDKERLSKYVMRKGDIIFSRVGSVDRRALVREEENGWLFSGRCLRVRPDNSKINSEYLSWFFGLEIFKEYIRRIAVGATMPSLNTELLSNVHIFFPSLTEQHAIAGILGSLDDKIDINQRMNRSLESIVQIIFQKWFVDNSDRENWKIGKLGEICESTIGGDWGEDQEFENSSPVFCLRGVDLDYLRTDGYSEAAPIRWVRKSSLEKRHLSNCDILIACSGIGPVGKSLWICPEILNAYKYPVAYSNFVKRFRARSPEYAVYVDRILFNMRKNKSIFDFVNGTSIPNLDDKGLLEFALIPIPPIDLLRKFFEFVRPIYVKLYNNEIRPLTKLRDTLLPKLMTGELIILDEEKDINNGNQKR